MHKQKNTTGQIFSAAPALNRRSVAGLLTTGLLAACSSGKNPTPPVDTEDIQLDILVTADIDSNSDIKGRGAPLVLRVYELKSEASFNDADFFQLQNHDKPTLGEDVLKMDSWILKPGETHRIRRPAQAATRAIGVFAAFRDLPNAHWRAVRLLPTPRETRWYRVLSTAPKLRLVIQAQARGLLLSEPEPGKR